MANCNAKNDLPWNKGKLIGQKLPLKLKVIWAIRVRLQLGDRKRDLALFNLAIDSKLRGSDLVKIQVCDIANSGAVMSRAMVMQQKTGRPAKFEITEQTRNAVSNWIRLAKLSPSNYLFPSRIHQSPHLSLINMRASRLVGAFHWTRSKGVWNTFNAKDKSNANLQKN